MFVVYEYNVAMLFELPYTPNLAPVISFCSLESKRAWKDFVSERLRQPKLLPRVIWTFRRNMNTRENSNNNELMWKGYVCKVVTQCTLINFFSWFRSCNYRANVVKPPVNVPQFNLFPLILKSKANRNNHPEQISEIVAASLLQITMAVTIELLWHHWLKLRRFVAKFIEFRKYSIL